MQNAIRVAMVEDQRLFLRMLTAALETLPSVEIVGAFESAEAADLAEIACDVVVCDISLPGVNGVDWCLRRREAQPDLGVLLLSSHAFPGLLSRLPMTSSEGWGYLLKDTVQDVAELGRAIEVVADGGMIIDRSLRSGASAATGSPLDRLTPGQRQLLGALSGGWSNESIATQLTITVKSVENAVSRLYQQLGIDSSDRSRNSRVEATRLFVEHSVFPT